jgi:uncharacterized protein
MTPGRARAPRLVGLLLAALAAAGPPPALPQGREGPREPEVPPPAGWVNDHAGVLDAATRRRLERYLGQVRDRTGAEFAVLTVRSTAPLTPSEYKVRVFERWGLGRRGRDDGLLLLVALAEREARFETGYGLEGTLPDLLQTRIVRDLMAPRFRAGDAAGAIVAGVRAAAERIASEQGVRLQWDGPATVERPSRRAPARLPLWSLALILVVLAILLWALGAGSARRGPRRRRGGFGDGWGGGFGGWSGGFGGGSGSFGGGSFGGFGGGASGGGGGGGKW